MDVDMCGGGDGTRRNMDSAGEGTMEIVPLEMYDSARAKIDANLRWLFAKAYSIDHIPEDLRDPFYTDQYEQEHIKPPVLHLLLSCELYCRVCSLILKTDQAASLQSHMSVIQALSRKGIYVMESDDAPVTDADLACVPIKMSAHMPMIDALMMAYTVEMISIEKVVASVKRFSTFSASKELPFDLEDAMVFWINKVNLKMREITERELKAKQHPLESPSHQKVRYRRENALCRQLPFFPLLEDLMRDVCDGAALLIVVHYYCPDLMKLHDICLKEVTSIADSLYNIQLLKQFSNEYLNKSFYLTMEDMLYSPLVLKHNVMVFIAELFWWFETVKPEFVQPRTEDFKDARAMAQPKSARPSVPISNATKRSFQVTPGIPEASLSVSAQSSPDGRYVLYPAEDSDPLNKGGPGEAFSPSHPLLPLRQRQQKQQQGEDGSGTRNRSNSLENKPPRGSVQAWSDRRQRPTSTLNPYTFGISATDSDADIASGDSVSLGRSISKDSLASNVVNLTPQGHTLIGHAQVGRAPVSPAPRRVNGHGLLGNVNMEEELVAVMRTDASASLPSQGEVTQPTAGAEPKDSSYLEPLMPAVLKSAKEKSVCLNKEEESGEVGRSRGGGSIRRVEGGPELVASARRKTPTSLNRTYTPASSGEFDLSTETSLAGPLQGQGAINPMVTSSVDPSSREPAGGFYLHSDSDDQKPWQDQEPDLGEADEEDLDEALTTKDPTRPRKTFDEEEESAKLQEDLKVKENRNKKKGDDGGSGRSSPCLSTHSQASSLASGSVRMTSFAERKAQQRFGSNQDLRTSASSSQRTTPDGSECSGPLSLPTSRRLNRDQSPSSPQGGRGNGGTIVLASELVQLHMQLEEKRKAIEHQKKKMEMLSARQRQKLGKAAFLHIVKKGKSDTLPNPLKPDYYCKEELNGDKGGSSKDDSCVDALRGAKEPESATSPVPGALEMVDRKGSCSPGLLLDEELDLNECNQSIEMLNDAIGSIQQQMMQLSLQQDLLMKQNVQSPPRVLSPCSANEKTSASEPKAQPAVHFVDLGSCAPTTGTAPSRKPPKLSSARGPRTKPSELKLAKEQGRPVLASNRAITPSHSLETLPHLRQFPGGRSPRTDHPDASPRTPSAGGETISGQDKPGHNATFRLHDEANLRTAARIDPVVVTPEMSFDPCLSSTLREGELNSSDGSGTENIPSEEVSRSKAPLIEVDLSDLKDPEEMEGDRGQESTMDGEDREQKSGLGFFFKDEQKAEDELAKKREAFLIRQQKKAEEARLRKLQLEAETEQKRDEARRKAEEDRMRKEEEKARRELIKEQYLRRKQQELMEEQGLGSPAKPKTPKTKPKKPSHQTLRPKSVFSREEISSDTFSSKCSSSTPDNLSSVQSGSSLSLASAATTEADSFNCGGPCSQRGEFVESFPGLSRNASRNTERDWDNGSTASSITSMAEYTGPKLFKEPSSKSNKPIIFNAISHCCLAGKVNEPQKNTLLEELERVDAHHLMILFRDGGCQFRGVYSYFPDTEEILKLTGTGPKSISKKMIDKLYKYSSDRKQFTVIPAKTVSVSIDAITIHNHLWQAKRTTVPKKSGK
ncbi:calmodulin-regulated spectrin-associated protein 1-B-like isoform X1 [Coregonus clupeaformis]|uniref:calmodulin-regulated spectrin-associated protein 1-B-like isoform X1 n=1 Tax=Coregonus clupeaformis TaxID=59861 RepID=UPI001E1C6684|nr:calmodulin-regulated spectrin-associated protein 1-B-like isoform X1 [Coregonus clupeaformis]XP_041727499.2 calmodulin-regulated spectrin-associated protein 1-B-like isoform X1 [Coregonus clupeaformis]